MIIVGNKGLENGELWLRSFIIIVFIVVVAFCFEKFYLEKPEEVMDSKQIVLKPHDDVSSSMKLVNGSVNFGIIDLSNSENFKQEVNK